MGWGNDTDKIIQVDVSGEVQNNLNKVNKEVSKNINNVADVTASLRAGYYEGPLVSFVFDDANITDYTKAKPIFESEGVPGNACTITSLPGNNPGVMTWEQMKELKELGWTIGSHMHDHLKLDELTEEQIEYQFKTSRDLLKQHNLDWDVIVYPYGLATPTALKVARKYFKIGVNVVRDYLSNEIPFIDNLNLVRAPGLSEPKPVVAVEPTLAECKAKVDEAITNKRWLIFEDHFSYAIWTTEKLEELRQLIQYIKSKGVPIVNLQDGFNAKGNVLDIQGKQKMKIFRDGTTEMPVHKAFTGLNDINKYTASTPYTAFPKDCITTFNFNSSGATGFPCTAGTVTNYHSSFGAGWNRQELSEYNGNRTWKRYVKSDNSWSVWSRTNTYNVIETLNPYTASSPITDYPAGTITTFASNSSNSTGFPNSKSGLVITYRVFGNGWDRQEFRVHASNEVWSRYTDGSTGAWTAWVKISAV